MASVTSYTNEYIRENSTYGAFEIVSIIIIIIIIIIIKFKYKPNASIFGKISQRLTLTLTLARRINTKTTSAQL